MTEDEVRRVVREELRARRKGALPARLLGWWTSAVFAAVVVEGNVRGWYFGVGTFSLIVLFLFHSASRRFLMRGGDWTIDFRNKLIVLTTAIGLPTLGSVAFALARNGHGNWALTFVAVMVVGALAGIPHAANMDANWGAFTPGPEKPPERASSRSV